MGSGGGTRTFAGTCLAGEDQDLEHLEKRRLQQMIMICDDDDDDDDG